MDEFNHEKLRSKYSKILKESINDNEKLNQLTDKEMELIFNELTKWFGTSPPETKRVKNDLKKIIEEKLDTSSIKLG